jgi:hypothetical protein
MTSRKRVVHNELDTAQVDEIEFLAAAGTPIKRICRELKRSRHVVRKVARGEHTSRRLGKIHRRCPGCGGKQKMPCRVCAARQAA